METIEVRCPDCPNILIVDRKSGKVLEVRRPIAESGGGSGDRFEDARQKVLGIKDRAEQKFDEAKERRKSRLEEIDKLFSAKTKELKDQKIERPEGHFDND